MQSLVCFLKSTMRVTIMVYLQSTYPPVEKYGLAGNEKIVKSRKKIVSSQPSLFNSRIIDGQIVKLAD